jgi:hypothetical protein
MQPIMQTAIHVFLLDGRQALVIWATLAALAILAFLLLSATARREWSGVARAGAAWAALRRDDLTAQTAELHRYAEELTIAAQRAAVTARRRHDEWAAAQNTVESAWRAFEEADVAARRAVQASAITLPRTTLTPSDVAARERHLHRAATNAYHAGVLSIEQLMDALSGRNGWDPCRHPADQEVILRRIARSQRLAAYQAASATERVAWHDSDVAAAARRSLDDEVFAATAAARNADEHLAAATPRRARHRGSDLPAATVSAAAAPAASPAATVRATAKVAARSRSVSPARITAVRHS